MIVISGALVLAALGLLIAGLISSGLTLVYASIGISLLSAAFLGLGVYQRRGETLTPAGATEPMRTGPSISDVLEGVRAVPAPASTVSTPTPVTEPSTSDDTVTLFGDAQAGEVIIVPGRPRYHLPGCRYLVGRETETRSIGEARIENYTACTVCRPDDLVEAAPAAAPATSRSAAASGRRTAADRESQSSAEPGAQRAASGARRPPEAPPRPRRAAAVPSGRGGAKATAASPAPAKATRGSTVMVIPDRGKYHQADCRFVRGNDEALEMSKASARRQGYEPCGVCKP